MMYVIHQDHSPSEYILTEYLAKPNYLMRHADCLHSG